MCYAVDRVREYTYFKKILVFQLDEINIMILNLIRICN